MSLLKKAALVLMIAVFAGCATNAGTQNNGPRYNSQTGQAHQSYTTGDLGTGFVKHLFGFN